MWTVCVPLGLRPGPSAAKTSGEGGTNVFSFLSLTSLNLIAVQTLGGWLDPLTVAALTATAALKAAPTRLPTKAWLELEGIPNHQVNKFQKMAATSPQMSTSCVTNRASTKPEEIVLATAKPKND